MVMRVLRILRGRTWRCVNLSDGVTLQVSVDGTAVCKSIVPSAGSSSLPVTLSLVILEQNDTSESRKGLGWVD